MSDYRVAKRYAKSLFELAIERNNLEEAFRSIDLIRQVCDENRQLVLLLRNPIIRYDHKLRILKRIFENHIDDMTLRFVLMITRKNRAPIIPDIAEAFIQIYNEHKNITIARVTTAVPIQDALRKDFLERIGVEGGKVILEEKVDDSIIGGFVLNIGDKQFDSSLKTKINKLRKELTKEL